MFFTALIFAAVAFMLLLGVKDSSSQRPAYEQGEFRIEVYRKRSGFCPVNAQTRNFLPFNARIQNIGFERAY
jgi:hypothetical protein